VLALDTPRRQIASDALTATLELHATTEEESISIANRTVPLEAEPTAVIATTLAAGRFWESELAAFLGNALQFKAKPTLLRAMQPYRRGKIPVVFVHGTASSVFRWADMVNDLLADPRIRGRYQFWFFTYDSGNPILYSAYWLRKLLSDQVQRLDPEGTDAALQEMIVIGHSQGGSLTKMTAVHSGDRFWHNVSSKPTSYAWWKSPSTACIANSMKVGIAAAARPAPASRFDCCRSSARPTAAEVSGVGPLQMIIRRASSVSTSSRAPDAGAVSSI
jgi:pimeloyl-ACP methyl ester carboxylesterase